MTRRFELMVAAPLFAWLGCRTAPESADGDPAQAAQSLLNRMVQEREAPGIQYAMLDENGVVFAGQAGKADLEEGAEVTAATLFQGFSVTKTFTAAAVVKLSLEGKVSLDAPISRYVPELANGRATPTVRQVLAHTAGYANPIPMAWVHLAEDHARFDGQAFVDRMIREHGKAERAPGEKFAYSNVGYVFLGEVIRRVSGRPYTQYVEEELIAPLRLPPGAQLQFEMKSPAPYARGYIARFSFLNASLGWFIDRDAFMSGSYDGWNQFRKTQVDGAAFGGLIGNAAGFSRYLQALLKAEPPFTLSLQKELFAQQKTSAGEAIGMALSWFVGQTDSEPYFDHAGGGGGFYCEIRLYPQSRRASVLMSNRTGIKNDHLLDRIDALFPTRRPFQVGGPPLSAER